MADQRIKNYLSRLSDAEKADLLLELSSEDVSSLDQSNDFEIDLISEYADGIRHTINTWGKHQGVDFGYESINDMTLGMTDGEVMLLSGDSNHGKALRNKTLIPTPEGFKWMGEMKVGDTVFGRDGQPTMVTGVYPQGKVQLYRVKLSDGTYLDTCAEHQWSVYSQYNLRKPVGGHGAPNPNYQKLIVKTTGDMLKGGTYYVPASSAVELPTIDLPIEPYELGLMLGDGCFHAGGYVELSLGDEELASLYNYRLDGNAYRVGIKGISSIIKSLGLNGVNSHQKFIPRQYLRASIEQRKALLAGLLDTDGSCSQNQIEFSTSSALMARDVKELVASLGGSTRTSSRIPIYTHKGETKSGKMSYRLTIRTPFNPFRLERKAYVPAQKGWNRKIVSIEKIDEDEATCISVDNDDHLYLAGEDFIATHNTQLALNMAFRQARQGNMVFFITLEMTQEQIGARIVKIAMQAGLSMDEALSLPVTVQRTKRLDYRNVGAIVAQAKRNGASMVFLDHVHSFARSAAANKTTEVAAISMEIKRAALENDISIVALAQCRKLEDHNGKPRKPNKNDLKDASELYQDCDLCLMVWRDKFSDGGKHQNEVEVRIWKNRLREMRYGHQVKQFISIEGASLIEDPSQGSKMFPTT